MDQLHWKSGWVEGSKKELDAKLANVIAKDSWIIDGNYGSTLPQRLEKADTVIYLDYPISLCVQRLFRRIWTYRGRTRPDMTEGCPERFNLPFLLYLIRWNRGPRIRLEAELEGHEDKVIRFHTPLELQNWTDSLS